MEENDAFYALENGLEHYMNESMMAEEVRAVIGDNQKLTAQMEMMMRERGHPVDNDNELKAQLAMLMKERDSLYVLWQTSQKTIEALESELKIYQSYGDTEPRQNKHEDRREMELKLETALNDYLDLEKKQNAMQTKISSLEQELINKQKEITSLKEIINQLEINTKELKQSLEECRINLEAEKKNNEDFKTRLNVYQKENQERFKKETEAKAKVAEALQLFDVVSVQKHEAYKNINKLNAELAKVTKDVQNAKRDAESIYRVEMDELRNKYNEKITDMLIHIKNLDSELIEKGMLLNKALREIKILKQEKKSFQKEQNECLNALEPKLKLAEQRIETMFQELVASERRNIQLGSEKQCLAIEIQRIQDIHAREIKRREWEEGLLKTQCAELKAQVEHLQKSLDETHGMVNKLQKMLTSKSELNQKIVSTKEEELIELNKHLENQMELNRKWKESYVEMTEKLKKKLDDLLTENTVLREQLNLPLYSDDQNENNGGH